MPRSSAQLGPPSPIRALCRLPHRAFHNSISYCCSALQSFPPPCFSSPLQTVQEPSPEVLVLTSPPDTDVTSLTSPPAPGCSSQAELARLRVENLPLWAVEQPHWDVLGLSPTIPVPPAAKSRGQRDFMCILCAFHLP